MSNKDKLKKDLTKKVEGKYEITMYKLLIVFAVSLFAAAAIGGVVGKTIGFSRGVDAVEVTAPDYCNIIQRGEAVSIDCGDAEIMSINDFCEDSLWATKLSDSLKEEINVIITFSDKA